MAKPSISMRKPGQRAKPSEDAIAALENRAEGIATKAPGSKPAATRKAKPQAATSSSKLRRDERGERVTAYLPPDVAAELRVACARDRRSVSDAITVAVGAWLAEQG